MDARERALSEIRTVLARRPPLREAFAGVARSLQALPRHTGVYLYVLRGEVLDTNKNEIGLKRASPRE